jgi:modulator of FtsH protease
MSSGYEAAGWVDLFLATAGATAALNGLIFVGLSVNIKTVLEIEQKDGGNFLTGRALEALVALLDVLVVSLVAMTPRIASGALGAFVLLGATVSGISPMRAHHASRHLAGLRPTMLLHLLTAWALTLTLAIAGFTVIVGNGGGLYWLPAAFVLAIAIAATNAWVLLVEILR